MEKKDSTETLISDDSYEENVAAADDARLLKRPNLDTKSFKVIKDEAEASSPSSPSSRFRRSPTRRNLKIEYKPEKESDATLLLDHPDVVSQLELKRDDSGNVIKKNYTVEVDGKTEFALVERNQTPDEEGRESPTRLMRSEQLRDRLVKERNEKYKKMVPFGGKRRRTRATRTVKRKRLLRKKKRKTKRRR